MPYSSAYDARRVFDGSLPSLRTGAKPAFSRSAIAEPKMNPRLSMPTTTSMPAARVRRSHRVHGHAETRRDPSAASSRRRTEFRASENPARAGSASSSLRPSAPRSCHDLHDETRPCAADGTSSIDLDVARRARPAAAANLPLEPLDGFAVALDLRLDASVWRDCCTHPRQALDGGSLLREEAEARRPARGRSPEAPGDEHRGSIAGLLHDDRPQRPPSSPPR